MPYIVNIKRRQLELILVLLFCRNIHVSSVQIYNGMKSGGAYYQHLNVVDNNLIYNVFNWKLYLLKMTFKVEYHLSSSSQGLESLRFITNVVFLAPVCLFGTIGNILSALVLRRKEMRSSVSTLMSGLAVCDTLFLVTQAISFGLYYFLHFYDIWPKYRFYWDPLLTPYFNLVSVTGES